MSDPGPEISGSPEMTGAARSVSGPEDPETAVSDSAGAVTSSGDASFRVGSGLSDAGFFVVPDPSEMT